MAVNAKIAALTGRTGVSETNERTFAGYRRALRSRNRSEQTIESYAKAIRELDSFLGGADVTEASKQDIEDYLGKRMTQISATTVAIRFDHCARSTGGQSMRRSSRSAR